MWVDRVMVNQVVPPRGVGEAEVVEEGGVVSAKLVGAGYHFVIS